MRALLLALAGAIAVSAQAGINTWDTTGPLATGVDVRVISALAVSPDGQTLYAGTGAGSVFQYTYADAVPASFSFTDQTGVAFSTLIASNTITVSGINVTATISVTGGEYEINGNGTWRTDAGTVSSGATVKVRHTSSGSYSSTVNTTLTIGGVSDTFSTTTLPIPTYAVTASASPSAGGTASCMPNPVHHGGSSTCTATAHTNYVFTGWTGPCTVTSATCTLSDITSTKSSTANFKQNPAIIFSANPPQKASPGTVVTLTATISGSHGTPTGTVSFFNGMQLLASSVPLSNGVASMTTYTLPTSPAPQVLRVQYFGDNAYMPGMQAMQYLVSEKVPTQISLAMAPNPSGPGETITATAQITATFVPVGEITGTVMVSSSDGPGCAMMLPATQCTMVLSNKGRTTITATYSGDANYSDSSTNVQHRVGKSSIVPILNLLLN